MEKTKDINSDELENSGAESLQGKVAKTEKLSRVNVAQLITHGINNIISVFVTTFLISYIYSISNNYMLNIGIFYVANYFTMGVAYILISKVIDRTNRVVFYRIALILRAIFILMIIFVGGKLANLVALAGLINGFSDAFYYASFNVMKNELVSRNSIKTYTAFQTGIENFIKFVMPIILGKIIDSQSFKSSAIIVAVVVFIQITVSFAIKSKRPENSSFELFDFFKQIKSMGEKKSLVVDGITVGAIYGLSNCSTAANTIFIMLVYNSNFSLGILNGVFSLLALIFLIFISKFTKPGKRNLLFISCGILPLLSAIFLSIFANKVVIIIFTLILIVCSMSYIQPFDLCRNVVMKKLNMYDSIAEFQGCIEFTMEMSRVFSFGLMAIFGVVGACFGNDGLILACKIFVVMSSAFLLILNLFLMFYEKKLVKNQIL